MSLSQDHVYLFSVDFPTAEAHVALKTTRHLTLCGEEFKDLEPFKKSERWNPDNGICETCAKMLKKHLADKYKIVGW